MRVPLLLCAVLSLIAFSSNARAQSEFALSPIDDRELLRLQKDEPAAREAFEGIRLAIDMRDFEGAKQALLTSASESFLFSRYRCLVGTELDEPAAVLDTCELAATVGASPVDRWAFVRARARIESPLSAPELSSLARHAAAAQSRGPSEIWGWLAECELGRKTGDRRLLSSCTSELERIAPAHPLVMPFSRDVGGTDVRWLPFALLGLLGLATLVHATSMGARRRTRHIVRVAPVVGVLLFAAQARAEDGTISDAFTESVEQAAVEDEEPLFEIDDADPARSIPPPEVQEKSPVDFGYFVMALASRADEAFNRGDYETALRYYDAIAKAVPDRSVGYTKSCECYEALGRVDEAVEACRAALGVEGVQAGDYARYVNLKLSALKQIGAEEIEEVGAIVEHLRSQGADETVIAQVECELGARTADEHRLVRCVPILSSVAPDEPRTLTYQWSLALIRGDQAQAERYLAKAKASGLTAQGVESMEMATRQAGMGSWSLTSTLLVISTLMVGLGALALWRRSTPLQPHTDGA